MGKTILVTGSQGTLGKKLVAELRGRGHDVFGADLHHGEYHEIRADVSEMRQVDNVFGQVQPEVVYHLAAEFGRMNGDHYAEQLWKHNCLGTRNVIEACIKGDAHLVFASSSEAYGDTADDGILHEDDLIDKVPSFHNEYALSKYTNEKQIQIAQNRYGLKATILRFFNAYGPGEYYNAYRSVVCLFIYRLMKGLPITVYKDYHRVFMYVDDWARTVAGVADRTEYLQSCLKHSDRIFNVGGTEYMAVEELVKMIVEKLGGTDSEINVLSKEAANIQNKQPNVERARQILDHWCYTTLDEGLDTTIQWMKETYPND